MADPISCGITILKRDFVVGYIAYAVCVENPALDDTPSLVEAALAKTWTVICVFHDEGMFREFFDQHAQPDEVPLLTAAIEAYLGGFEEEKDPTVDVLSLVGEAKRRLEASSVK